MPSDFVANFDVRLVLCVRERASWYEGDRQLGGDVIDLPRYIFKFDWMSFFEKLSSLCLKGVGEFLTLVRLRRAFLS